MEALAWIAVASIMLACLITLLTEPRPQRRVLVSNRSDAPVFDVTVRRIEHRSRELREADQARVDRLGFP